MKRKKNRNHPPSIDPSSNAVDLTSNPVDPSFNEASSSPFVNNSREKMKRKKNCNHPPSIDPSSNAVDPTSNLVDASFNATSSSNPIPNPTSSSNPISNADISFFNKNCKYWIGGEVSHPNFDFKDYGGFVDL
ncbi:unnamed protein product [Ilex paraguariensis]|uniref:Uncharacterized protein n=1 Tax=Ilex paraguariensis TaxID=185542 RepID=A0ABC8R0G7_9AQUA